MLPPRGGDRHHGPRRRRLRAPELRGWRNRGGTRSSIDAQVDPLPASEMAFATVRLRDARSVEDTRAAPWGRFGRDTVSHAVALCFTPAPRRGAVTRPPLLQVAVVPVPAGGFTARLVGGGEARRCSFPAGVVARAPRAAGRRWTGPGRDRRARGRWGGRRLPGRLPTFGRRRTAPAPEEQERRTPLHRDPPSASAPSRIACLLFLGVEPLQPRHEDLLLFGGEPSGSRLRVLVVRAYQNPDGFGSSPRTAGSAARSRSASRRSC
jgi:hypothetical protein